MAPPERLLPPAAPPTHGLPNATVARLQPVLQRHPQVEKAVLYGSRAKGNYHPGSDIDLTLHGPALSLEVLGSVASDLDDLLLPYTVDLSIFDALDNAELRHHIDRVGRVFYQRPVADASLTGI